jgi:hypothetical protein
MKDAKDSERENFIKNNHQYILEVKEDTDILMLLMQEDGRNYRG